MRVILCVLGLLWSVFAVPLSWAQTPKNLVNNEAPTSSRCVNAAGTAFESCSSGVATLYASVTWSCFLEAVTVTTECRVVAGAGLRNYVTSATLSNQAGTVQSLDIVFGTGAACVTGTTALTHKWQFGTVATTTSPFVVSATFPSSLVPTAATAICVRPSAATAFGVTLTGYVGQ